MNDILINFLSYRVDISHLLLLFVPICFILMYISMVFLEEVDLYLRCSDRIKPDSLPIWRTGLMVTAFTLSIIVSFSASFFFLTSKSHDGKAVKALKTSDIQALTVSDTKSGICLTNKDFSNKSAKCSKLKLKGWRELEVPMKTAEGKSVMATLVYPKGSKEFVEGGTMYGQPIEYFDFEVNTDTLASKLDLKIKQQAVEEFENYKFLIQIGEYKVPVEQITSETLSTLYSYCEPDVKLQNQAKSTVKSQISQSNK